MIKKYTILLFTLMTFLFTGAKSMHAMSGTNHFSPDRTDEYIDSMFLQDEPVAFRSAKLTEAFADDPLTEDYTVWAANGSIYIRTNKAVDVNIYTITGQLSKRMKITAGETAIAMPRGLYIVRIENVARKVVVR